MDMKMHEIELSDIQAEINRYAKGRAPKSVKNFSGFISAVFKLYRPRFNYDVKLPQKKKYKGYVPTEEDVKRILEASKGSHYHIGFQLAVLSLRRSEICGATIDDVRGNILTINKDRIYDENNHLMTRDNTKTEESTREIYLPDSLVEEIREAGYIYDRTPPMLVKTLHKYQDELEIPRFRLHDLRVFFVSYAHSLKIPDLYIQKAGGWKSDFVMKNTYLKELKDKTQEAQQNIVSKLF
jgi:integrase